MVKLLLSKTAKQTPCKKETTGKFFVFFFFVFVMWNPCLRSIEKYPERKERKRPCT